VANAYAIAHLHDPGPHPEVFEYIERIQATMDPYRGRFIVHGPQVGVLEGAWPGTIVIIEFPDAEAAHGWYESPAYQEILPLRTEHSNSMAALVAGVPANYQATDKIAQLLGEAS
jgi:uncharacterized protein (DUF1330 family)